MWYLVKNLVLFCLCHENWRGVQLRNDELIWVTEISEWKTVQSHVDEADGIEKKDQCSLLCHREATWGCRELSTLLVPSLGQLKRFYEPQKQLLGKSIPSRPKYKRWYSCCPEELDSISKWWRDLTMWALSACYWFWGHQRWMFVGGMERIWEWTMW